MNQTEKCASVPRKSEQPGGHACALPLWEGYEAWGLNTDWCGIQKPSECGLWISEQLAAVPEFQGLGPLFKSSPEPVALTESETEYVIRCTKHTFSDHLVFQVSTVA